MFKDKLGQDIQEGDFVAWPSHNTLEVGIIVKINPRMVKVKRVEPPKRWQPSTWNKYPNNVVKLEGPIVSMYILKHSEATNK
jgi:hypothetical protein